MKVLLTGATGYIGRQLLPALMEEGHQVICLARNPRRLQLPQSVSEQVTAIEGDLLQPETLFSIPDDIEAAYYLVHSMSQSTDEFERMERESAQNFVVRLRQTGCRQVIYLGGITYQEEKSPHLASRLAVERILKNSGLGYTMLRAGIIIGSGSASFEIIRDLVEKLPVMIAPKWLNSPHQSIAISDVIFYLSQVLDHPECLNSTFDIGGPDILTYKQMLLTVARLRRLKRCILTVPVLTPKLSSYWLYFVTSTSFSLARTLVESLRNEVIARQTDIQQILPHRCLKFEEAVGQAFARIEKHEIVSSWKDAWSSGRISNAYSHSINIPGHGCLVDHQELKFTGKIEQVVERIWRIGGDNGWYFGNKLWAIRGFMDKLVGGVGLRRGRRHPTELREGDVLDFWRVLLADKAQGRLLLYVEMKLPGEAWLEFRIESNNGDSVLHQIATFRPRGLLGRLCWYSLMPLHKIIFQRMAERVVEV